MANKANDTFAFDLENRLDDFFSDPEPEAEAAAGGGEDPPPADEASGDSSLKALKSTILAIDWEITDDALDAFIGQVEELFETFRTDKSRQTLLKLLKSLGKYIQKRKSSAHPDTIKRIMSVYSALEEVVDNRGLTQEEREKILSEEVRQFQQLKSKIAAGRPSPKNSPKPADTAGGDDLKAVVDAIESLKSMIATEFGAIREAIAKLSDK